MGFVVTGKGAAQIGLLRGTALYIGALIGPGLLLIPALGVQAAGPASILAWLGLLLLSAPLAATFAALAVRYPVAAGVSAYVRAGFGDSAAAVTGAWFLAAIFLGAPAVSLIGGYYVTDLTGGRSPVAVFVGLCIFMTVITSNAMGLRVSSSVQFGLSTILVVVLAIALAFALPVHGGDNWLPFAPRGWWAIGTAANILIWMFVGWEAVAQLAGEFKRPRVDLPRAMALAFAIITILYLALAIGTVGVTCLHGWGRQTRTGAGRRRSGAPLARAGGRTISAAPPAHVLRGSRPHPPRRARRGLPQRDGFDPRHVKSFRRHLRPIHRFSGPDSQGTGASGRCLSRGHGRAGGVLLGVVRCGAGCGCAGGAAAAGPLQMARDHRTDGIDGAIDSRFVETAVADHQTGATAPNAEVGQGLKDDPRIASF